MLRLFINWLYKHCPTCYCGYKMKPINVRPDEFTWKCIFTKQCGYEAYESYNGTMHWFKKSEKK